VLDYDEVDAKFDATMDWLARTYVHTMNCIHYMHDKYFYERLEMALHDRDILRTMAFGIAGLSVVADSLSAIKHAKVHVIRDDKGLAVDYGIEGDFPKFGNNDEPRGRHRGGSRLPVHGEDPQAPDLPRRHPHPVGPDHHLERGLRQGDRQYAGRAAQGRALRARRQPDARAGRHGWLASCISVARLPYADAQDGISYTVSVAPTLARRDQDDASTTLVRAFDMYFGQGGFHMNLNVLSKETLLDAMEHPEKYPQLTIRVSGYAVNFVRLTREQQLDVIRRTFHASY
jgi:formate C-acetyltransferase